jgi:ferric-dicitrate binding protein FerR (iron transport regulator)
MDEHMYILIAKSLNQEASEQELQELNSWLQEDAGNLSAYNDMKLAWEEADLLMRSPQFDADAAWEKVAVSTVAQVNEKKGKTIAFKGWQKLSLAAAAILLIMLTITLLTRTDMEVITAGEGMLAVELPDHSRVSLHQGATLKYPKAFKKDERRVVLEGDAFFEVTHNAEHPFIVDAGKIDVQVLGTSFYVSSAKEQASVTVATGKVRMSTEVTGQQLILTPGNKGLYKQDQLITTTDTNFAYYRHGVLSFSGVSLADVLQVLSTVENVPIVMDNTLNASIRQQQVEISFRKEPLDKMLFELCLITNTRTEEDGNSYRIYAK